MQKDFVDAWNISDMEAEEVELVSRTSNGLERYNRHMKGIFPTLHPKIGTFASTLYEESARQITRMEDVRAGREQKPLYQEVVFPPIPDEYEAFHAHYTSPVKKKRSTRVSKKLLR